MKGFAQRCAQCGKVSLATHLTWLRYYDCMAVNQQRKCPVCEGTKFESGEMSTNYDKEAVRFRQRTSMITSDWTDVRAQMCTKCGYILLFAAGF